jgi:hypothetical protein
MPFEETLARLVQYGMLTSEQAEEVKVNRDFLQGEGNLFRRDHSGKWVAVVRGQVFQDSTLRGIEK